MKETKTYRPYPGARLNPRYDFVFKALFTENSDASRRALKSFLTAMIGKEIANVKLKPNEPPSSEIDGKDVRFDVACTFCDGESADIEMQSKNDGFAFNDREAYLVSRLMVHNFKKGQDYSDIKNVYQIGVLNFSLNDNSQSLVTHYKMRSDEGFVISEKLNIITLELPKLKNIESIDINSLQLYEKWAIFFKEADKPKKQGFVDKIIRSEEGLMGAQEVLDRISLDEIEWKRQLDEDVLASDRTTRENHQRRMLQASLEQGLQQGMERGLKQGIQQGIEQGIEQGIQQGISQGRAESQAEIDRLKAENEALRAQLLAK